MSTSRVAALAAIQALLLMATAAKGDSPAAIPPRAQELHAQACATPIGRAAGDGVWLVIIDSAGQEMTVWRGRELLRTFPVSTAKAGIGSREGSGKTPPGWHRVERWIGEEALPGEAFVSRVQTGEIVYPANWRTQGESDRILSRIMWLEGLEDGVNRGPGIDSHARFIYIHGTDQEQLLGTPASHGCIRMSNHDVLDLFHLTLGQETLVWIR